MDTFLSKLLLFGEHIVIKGARALATPYVGFQGSWQWAPGQANTPLQQSLPDFVSYIRRHPDLATKIDHEAFTTDLSKGLYFDSNIPTGYGLGSSGALCAAVYARYAHQAINREDWKRVGALQQFLGQMESFFHQSSSGVDPLVCYMKQALLLEKGKLPKGVEWRTTHQDAPLFLVDTQIARKTGPYVAHFLERYEDPVFRQALLADLFPANELAIDAFLSVDRKGLQQAFQQISHFQFEHFRHMIPSSIVPLWQEGLDTEKFHLKLCGAGGGGFMLGLAKDVKTLETLQLGRPVLTD